MLRVDGTDIYLTRGDTGIFTIALQDSEGEPYSPQEGDSLRFAMAKKYGSDDVLVIHNIPIDTMALEIDPEDTKALKFGAYVYDIQLTDGDGHISTVILGKLTLTEEVC